MSWTTVALRAAARSGLALLLASTAVLATGIAPAGAASDPPDHFVLRGTGFGHGVGMPQYGAYEMARQGNHTSRILKHYYSGTRSWYRSTPKNVSVQVYGPDPYGYGAYGDSSARTQVTVSGGGWRLRSGSGETLAKGWGTTTLTVVPRGGAIAVQVDGREYRGTPLRLQWTGTRYYKFRSDRRAVVEIDGAQGTYRHGRLTLSSRSGISNIVNDLLLNSEYLNGIAEMPSAWGADGGAKALRAQVITARSYSGIKASSPRQFACRCDLVDDVRDQNFTGWLHENAGPDGRYGDLWVREVAATTRSATEGRVLTYDGEPVVAHYFSSSGGRTANSEDVWTTALPYERSVDDPYSRAAPGNSFKDWKRTLTQEGARKLFGLTDVVTLRTEARWPSGQIRALRATASDGTSHAIWGKADRIRHRVGAHTTTGSMPSSWVRWIRPVA
ncbi:SpoIID/LytB domain-containing protein [Isoptericola haloaureus]|uniref:Sporulation stage II protein D amidase enhancer LytB N-terminal domain-containing protein n=1 Tax=Isoptericola haloaureus TaxID=1542902 RepID=A0ABU7Z5C9_9MICO